MSRIKFHPAIRPLGFVSYEKRMRDRLFLFSSNCDKCPGRNGQCKFFSKGAHFVFVDYLPDVWYDMPCSSGRARAIDESYLKYFIFIPYA